MAPIPAFIRITYDIFSNPLYEDCCGWNEAGDTVIIKNITLFSEVVLAEYFKASKFASFVRQLNMYYFKKAFGTYQNPNYAEYSHLYFRRGRTDLLQNMKRKCYNKDAKDSSRDDADFEEEEQRQQFEDPRHIPSAASAPHLSHIPATIVPSAHIGRGGTNRKQKPAPTPMNYESVSGASLFPNSNIYFPAPTTTAPAPAPLTTSFPVRPSMLIQQLPLGNLVYANSDSGILPAQPKLMMPHDHHYPYGGHTHPAANEAYSLSHGGRGSTATHISSPKEKISHLSRLDLKTEMAIAYQLLALDGRGRRGGIHESTGEGNVEAPVMSMSSSSSASSSNLLSEGMQQPQYQPQHQLHRVADGGAIAQEKKRRRL